MLSRILDGTEIAFAELIGDKRQASLLCGQLDDPINREGVITRSEFPRTVWPRGEDYRVVRGQSNSLYAADHLGLQAKVGDQWIDVCTYYDGHDEYGRLGPACWKTLADTCRWDEQSLRLLRDELLGIPRRVEVL